MKNHSQLRTTASTLGASAAPASQGSVATGVDADPATPIAHVGEFARRDDGAVADQAQASAGSKPSLAHLAWQKPMPRRKPGATQALVGLVGHSPECIGLVMSGRIASCDCRARPMEDPAVAVGLVMHYARTATTSRLPIPPAVIELLASHVEEGDPTCMVVARWLDDSGLLDITYNNNDAAAGRAQ